MKVWLAAAAALAAGLLASGADGAGGPKPEFLPAAIPTDHPWTPCTGDKSTGRYYPEKALRRELAGAAVIQCRLTPAGRTSACTWISDTPPGYDFGPAAAMLGCLINPSKDMPPGLGPDAVVKISINFRLPTR